MRIQIHFLRRAEFSDGPTRLFYKVDPLLNCFIIPMSNRQRCASFQTISHYGVVSPVGSLPCYLCNPIVAIAERSLVASRPNFQEKLAGNTLKLGPLWAAKQRSLCPHLDTCRSHQGLLQASLFIEAITITASCAFRTTLSNVYSAALADCSLLRNC